MTDAICVCVWCRLVNIKTRWTVVATIFTTACLVTFAHCLLYSVWRQPDLIGNVVNSRSLFSFVGGRFANSSNSWRRELKINTRKIFDLWLEVSPESTLYIYDWVLIGCVQSVAKSAETSASDVRDDDDDDDDDEDDVKLQSSGVDPDRLKAFNVSSTISSDWLVGFCVCQVTVNKSLCNTAFHLSFEGFEFLLEALLPLHSFYRAMLRAKAFISLQSLFSLLITVPIFP